MAEGLSSEPEARLDQRAFGVKALQVVQADWLHLVILESILPDLEPLSLVRQLLMIAAMVSTAVISPLSDEEFHEAREGLGVTCSPAP
jgi:hypothetical protein